MPAPSVRGVVGDTGFWIEAFDRGGEHHHHAIAQLERSRHTTILLPWPITYEVLRTQTVRRRAMVDAFSRVLRRPRVLLVDDTRYRVRALDATFSSALNSQRSISLVDMVVRMMLDDRTYRVSTLLTYNPADFSDVCRKRNIAIWPAGGAG